MRRIEVVEYDNEWPHLFEVEKQLLISSLTIKDLGVHNIGNTAVYGLAAKPVIDILLDRISPSLGDLVIRH